MTMRREKRLTAMQKWGMPSAMFLICEKIENIVIFVLTKFLHVQLQKQLCDENKNIVRRDNALKPA